MIDKIINVSKNVNDVKWIDEIIDISKTVNNVKWMDYIELTKKNS